MNINLANIDFAPGQGGGGEAVIRTLNVTENGTYRAPSGVDGYNPVEVRVAGGGSVTPEEQAALDTLVNSSEGALYTKTFEKYNQSIIVWPAEIYGDSASLVFWDDLYVTYNGDLYKLNRESYQFDMVNHFDGMWTGPSFFGDKSGRLYWNGNELDLENGTIGQVQVTLPGEIYRNGTLQNIFYGEYGVWVLGSYAYKFNESTQAFDTYPLNSTFGYGGNSVYLNLFKYDGHILGVYSGLTFEVTEYEDHIDVAEVTNVYFNMPSFGVTDTGYRSTKDGDLYILNMYQVYMYDKSSGVWENVKSLPYPIYSYDALVSDNIVFSFFNGSMYCMNLGQEFDSTSWTKASNFAVDLSSNQKISGTKTFNGQVITNALFVENVYTENKTMTISSGNNDMTIVGGHITFIGGDSNETVIKNGSKHIATVDQTIVNSTYIPYGNDGDNIGYVSGDSANNYNFNTYTNRMFKKYNGDWYEFDGTSTLIPVSFGFDFDGGYVYNSPTMTIVVVWDNVSAYNTYMWNDANTRWDLICSSDSAGGNVWFDGDDFRSGNTYKLVETGGVWSWVSDPLVNNIYEYNLKFGYKNGEVYAYNDSDWHLYKYDKANCALDKIGFVNAGGGLYSYFDELFFIMNGGCAYIVDLSKVDPQNPDEWILGDVIFVTSSYYIGATDRLWYYKNGAMYSSYQYIYDTPAVPASNGTYSLKAVRTGDTVTYSWVLDV